MSSRIQFGQVVKCAHCGRHLASFAMRLRCVFECETWLCRAGDCRDAHLASCSGYWEADRAQG